MCRANPVAPLLGAICHYAYSSCPLWSQIGASTRGSMHLDRDGTFPNHLANQEVTNSILEAGKTFHVTDETETGQGLYLGVMYCSWP